MDLLAQLEDLEAWLEEDVFEAPFRAEAVLDHASALIRIAAGETWLTTDPPDGIPQLTVRVAARMWLNPSGLKSSTTGPYSGTFGEMELTTGEKAEIWQIMHPGARRGLGTISTTRGPLETQNIYVDVVGSDEPLPVSREPW